MISAELKTAQRELNRRRFDLSKASCTRKCTRSNGWLNNLHPLGCVPRTTPVDPTPKPTTIDVIPDIATAILRHEQSSAGRIWHLLRALDPEGRGAFSIESVRDHICGKSSQWQCVGWRQLRNILRAGQGLFWARDKETVWLRSRVKVAAVLDVQRVGGHAVALPIDSLLGGLGSYKAALYSTFHAGRDIRPISRASLTKISSACASSQRNYEKTAAVKTTAQFAILTQSEREARWEHGAHIFSISDKQGVAGRRYNRVLVRQLPNCFRTNLSIASTNQKKRLNRNLRDLLTKGATGNTQNTDTTHEFERVYGIDCKNKQTNVQIQYVSSGRASIWHQIGQSDQRF